MSSEMFPVAAGDTNDVINPDDMIQAGQSVSRAGTNYLKFTKTAQWIFGMDNDEVDADEVLAVNPASFTAGWQGWNNGMPVEGPTVPYSQRSSLPAEADLDPLPSGDMNGWSPQLGVTLQSFDDGTVLQFNSTSDGGKKAILKLMGEVGLAYKSHPEAIIAMVKLEKDSYKHPSFGMINKPVFKVVGWADKDGKEVKKLAA